MASADPEVPEAVDQSEDVLRNPSRPTIECRPEVVDLGGNPCAGRRITIPQGLTEVVSRLRASLHGSGAGSGRRRSRAAALRRTPESSRASSSATQPRLRACGGGSCRAGTAECPRPRRRFGGRLVGAAAGEDRARAKSCCSSGVSRSYDHSMAALSVRCLGSASRPPLNRSSRCPSRSSSWAGVNDLVRAAASSSASGRLSSRSHRFARRLVVVHLEVPRARARAAKS